MNQPETKHRILIEANKLDEAQYDGVKRYLQGITQAMPPLLFNEFPQLQVDVLLNGHIYTVAEYYERLAANASDTEQAFLQDVKPPYERGLANIKATMLRLLPFGWAKRIVEHEWIGLIYGGFIKKHLTYGRQAPLRHQLPSYDLVHIPLPQHLYPVFAHASNLVVTIHDITHALLPHFHTRINRWLAEKGMQRALRWGVQFISVSQATQTDVTRHYSIDSAAICTIYEGVEHRLFSPTIDKHLLDEVKSRYPIVGRPFFLCLFTLEPRKNVDRTIDAFLQFKQSKKDSPYQLLIAGRAGWKQTPEQWQHPDIHFVGYVPEAHLPALYTLSRALCYVSLYEGFGLPPLEAMACGSPVIYGDNSSMRELLQDIGLPADAESVSSIAEAMHDAESWSEDIYNDKSQACIQHSLQFSWEKAARQTLGYYLDIQTVARQTARPKSIANPTACVIIPVYQAYNDLPDLEVSAYRQVLSVLASHPIQLIGPEEIVKTYPQPDTSAQLSAFSASHFTGIVAYNRLLVSDYFYRAFQAFDYVLIYQLDAWVFRDELLDWCRRGYDYVGAPMFLHNHGQGVGNGGFSLRRVSKMLEIVSHPVATHWKEGQFDQIEDRAYMHLQSLLGRDWAEFDFLPEDLFFTYVAPTFMSDFSRPSLKEAAAFSWEHHPAYLYKLNRQQLPFGAHQLHELHPGVWEWVEEKMLEVGF